MNREKRKLRNILFSYLINDLIDLCFSYCEVKEYYVEKWGNFGGGQGNFRGPSGLAISSINEIYAADCENHRIQVFDQMGRFIRQWGSNGSSDGQFNHPNGIVIAIKDKNREDKNKGDNGDKDDKIEVYVSDFHNSRIQVFDERGEFQRKWIIQSDPLGNHSCPSGIYVSDDEVHVIVYNGNVIRTYKRGFEALGSLEWGNNYLNYPAGITILYDEVYVGDFFSVQVFDVKSKKFLRKLTSDHSDGKFHTPLGLSTYSDEVYVCDFDHYVIQVFDQKGKFLRKWDLNPDKTIGKPHNLVITPSGKIYVTDYTNHQVQVFEKRY